jgi:hypothetical protein
METRSSAGENQVARLRGRTNDVDITATTADRLCTTSVSASAQNSTYHYQSVALSNVCSRSRQLAILLGNDLNQEREDQN